MIFFSFLYICFFSYVDEVATAGVRQKTAKKLMKKGKSNLVYEEEGVRLHKVGLEA